MLWTNPKILETSIVAGAPWGGPLAAVRSERVFQPATTHKLVPELQLFTARGRLIASLPWTFTRLVAMQWNEEEALVCVFADSVVRTFSPAGEKLHFFSLGEAIKAEGGIIQACIGKAGIAVLTSTNQVYINQAFDKARLLHLPTPRIIPDGPFVALAASRSNRFVAAVSNAGALQVLRVDASSVQLAASASFDRSRRVRQIHLVLLGGPNSEWLPLDFGSEPRGSGGGVVLVEEIDGLRVLTSTTAELIRRAAAATESVFGVGSICTCLREAPLDIRHQHLLAVRICEYSGLCPRGVLVSWSLAKISRCASLTDEELTEAVCSRMHAVARLPPAAAAAAAAAAASAKGGGGDATASLAQSFFGYAFYNRPAQQQQQLQLQSPLPFARLALCAAQAGRPVLATRLAAFEAEPKAQVSLLLKLAKVSLATEKAAEAADADLLLQCLAAALAADADSPDGRVDMSQLVEALHDHPAAQSVFAIYCKQTGQLQLLEQYYERVAAAQEAGLCCLSLAEAAAAAGAEWEQRRGWLAYAGGFFASVKDSQLPAAVAHSETLTSLELLSIQRDLEVKANTCGWLGPPHKFAGLSLMQTIRQLILKMEFAEADNLKKVFNVGDARYWRCKIDALADGMHFDELQAFAKYRTSPIGYEPFVEACLRKGNRELALQLTYKVQGAEARARFFSALGREDEAAAALQTPQQSVGGGLLQALSGAFSRRSATHD
ncbi:vacuolar protein sorting-associated protein 16 homolog [Cyclospora cayetanensis]|uniref:Vacuolar protein sorting-associated protein 16 homolog n=1 Tax=Cyclospora cayetanensis TaxID=88456 RepID=A0A6P6RZJ8_9EIME|nr:vacuolar protein sorting-associated protein 16 homolog [Cyclospora cayetanensis]